MFEAVGEARFPFRIAGVQKIFGYSKGLPRYFAPLRAWVIGVVILQVLCPTRPGGAMNWHWVPDSIVKWIQASC